MINILYTGPETEVLPKNSPYVQIFHRNELEGIRHILLQMDAILDANLTIKFNKDLLKLASNLKLFYSVSTGSSHVDVDFLGKAGVEFKSLRGDPVLNNVTATSELAFGLLVSVARNINVANQHVCSCKWQRTDFPGILLNGKILGVIGCGRLGAWMNRYGKAFGMSCIGYDPYLENLESMVSLDELLRTSDFISIHVPMTSETKHMIAKEELSKMKPDAVIINTSQRNIINELDLLDSLKRNEIRGAALDVLSDEPNIENNPLVEYAKNANNLILTPHIGGYVPEVLHSLIAHCFSRLNQYFREKK